MSTSIDWNDQRAFLAVIETGSLSAAARKLNMAQATVRARIESLENSLKTVLFTRSVNGLVPTSRALSLVEPAKAMANASDTFARTASTSANEVAGVVRLSAPEFIGVEILPTMLVGLRKQHPKLILKIELSNSLASILNCESDIAVLLHKPEQDSLLTRKVASIPLGLYAHQQYLASRGEPQELGDLSTHDIIGPDQAHNDLALAAETLSSISHNRVVLRTDSQLAQLAATRAGLGIAAIQSIIGDRDSRLRRVLPESTFGTLGAWIVSHENRQSEPKIRTVIDHLAAEFESFCNSEH